MRKFFSVIVIMFLGTLTVLSQESQKVMTFLEIPVSAHAGALGGDNVSVIDDDPSLAMSNPSLLASVSNRSLNFGYMNYMSGVNIFTAGYTGMINDKATIGGMIEYLNYGKLQQRDANNNKLGEFSPSDLVIEPVFSYTLARNLVGGVGGKFIYSKIGDYASTAAAIDLGLNYYSSEKDFSASFVVKNLGGQLSSYNEEYESLPTDVLLGISKGFSRLPFRISLTLCDLTNWDYSFFQHACIGVDVTLIQQFYLSGGYNFRRAHDMSITSSDGSESSHGAGWSFGGGLNLNRFSIHVSYGKFHLVSNSLMANLIYRM